jgi:hypothetical protein
MKGRVYEANDVSEREKGEIFRYIQNLCLQTHPECRVTKFAHSVVVRDLKSWPDVYTECLKSKYPFLTVDIFDAGEPEEAWMVCVGFGKRRKAAYNIFLLIFIFLVALAFLMFHVDFFVQESMVSKNPFASNATSARAQQNKTREPVFPKRAAI